MKEGREKMNLKGKGRCGRIEKDQVELRFGFCAGLSGQPLQAIGAHQLVIAADAIEDKNSVSPNPDTCWTYPP